jgi:hypothetical protein
MKTLRQINTGDTKVPVYGAAAAKEALRCLWAATWRLRLFRIGDRRRMDWTPNFTEI